MYELTEDENGDVYCRLAGGSRAVMANSYEDAFVRYCKEKDDGKHRRLIVNGKIAGYYVRK